MTISCYCYWCMPLLVIILLLNQGTAETPHMIACYPLSIFRRSHNVSVWRHLLSGSMYPPHYPGQTNTKPSWYTLNQRNKLSSCPTFVSRQSSVWCRICGFCTVKVFICIFGRCRCGVGWSCLCWCPFSSICCLVSRASRILEFHYPG